MLKNDRPIGVELLGCGLPRFGTLLADPPWRFQNRRGKFSPECPGRHRYDTLSVRQIAAMPVDRLALPRAHLYLWVLNGQIEAGFEVMRRWGFTYKTNLVWCKSRKDGAVDRSGIGNYFRHASEIILFGVRGSLPTRARARRQVNVILAHRREHSRKPDELYDVIETCSSGPRLELFARYPRTGWFQWGNQINERLHTDAAAPAGGTTVIRTYRERFIVYRGRCKPRRMARREGTQHEA